MTSSALPGLPEAWQDIRVQHQDDEEATVLSLGATGRVIAELPPARQVLGKREGLPGQARVTLATLFSMAPRLFCLGEAIATGESADLTTRSNQYRINQLRTCLKNIESLPLAFEYGPSALERHTLGTTFVVLHEFDDEPTYLFDQTVSGPGVVAVMATPDGDEERGLPWKDRIALGHLFTTAPAVYVAAKKIEWTALLGLSRGGSGRAEPPEALDSFRRLMFGIRSLLPRELLPARRSLALRESMKTAHHADSLYLVEILDDLVPCLHGPFRNIAERDSTARNLRRANPGMENGIYQLDVGTRTARVAAYAGEELDTNLVGEQMEPAPPVTKRPSFDNLGFRWLLVVWGDVDPALKGPFADASAFDAAWSAHKKKYGQRDGLFALYVSRSGVPSFEPRPEPRRAARPRSAP